MKTTFFYISLFLLAAVVCVGQPDLLKTIPVEKGQRLQMKFDYPELVKISTWDKNEISIQGSIDINGGENNDAFTLTHTTSGNTVIIESKIRDLSDLPQRVTVVRDGQKHIFKNKSEFKKYQQEHGGGYDVVSYGAEIQIVLDIKIPANMQTQIESVYGMVEVRNFSAPLTVVATYGGVDASLKERAVGEIVAETNYGEIFTNLDIKFNGEESGENFHTLVSAKPGSGPTYNLESTYGNVYIRKEIN